MILLVVMAAANAQEAQDASPTSVISAWSRTAAEALPDARGESLWRASETLGLDATAGDWSFQASGAVRAPADTGRFDTYDLYQGVATGPLGPVAATVGRLVRRTPTEWQHVDGAELSLHGESWRATAFGGRAWHPEAVMSVAYPGTWLGGAELRLSPAAPTSFDLDAAAGWTTAVTDGEATHRAQVLVGTRGARGGHLDLSGEADPVEAAGRAALAGAVPVGRALDLDAELRWEGLEPIDLPGTVTAPLIWLAPDGYGVAGAGATLNLGAARVRASGGAVQQAGGEQGAKGTLSASTRPTDSLALSAFGTGAGIGSSWLAGGGGSADVSGPANTHAGLLAAAYAVQGPDGDATPCWETRLTGGVLAEVERVNGLRLDAMLATGADPILARWVRAGIVVGLGPVPGGAL